jgi:hypothetical protein
MRAFFIGVMMKKLKEVIEVENEGLIKLLNQKVLLMCANYFYCGKLVGVNDDCVLLENPHIVYETGAWDDDSYSDAQEMHADQWYVAKGAVESFGLSK